VPARLIYSSLASLDGYTVDEDGNFDWAEPDAEVHAFVNDTERGIGTFLLGRRMYDVMKVWETLDDDSAVLRDFATIWRAADKIVYSRTLEDVSTSRTRLEREFDPDVVQRMKTESDRDLGIGGPGLAERAVRAGLVDEWHLFLVPYLAGGGTRFFPDGVHTRLTQLEERRFRDGTVFLRYATAR
jgi:dihydrofolate reductase